MTHMHVIRIILVWLGVVCIGISLVTLSLGAFGFLGVLADVGPEENRELGFMFLRFGLPWLVGGTVLCTTGLLVFRRKVGHERDNR